MSRVSGIAASVTLPAPLRPHAAARGAGATADRSAANADAVTLAKIDTSKGARAVFGATAPRMPLFYRPARKRVSLFR